MASPPVISAPTLVTSTNHAATVGHAQAGHAQVGHTQVGHAQAVMATPSVIPSQNDNDDWHFKYLEAKGNYRKLKSQKREQAKKSRQLIVAVKNKLQDEDNEKLKMRSQFEQELSGLCQQLLALQAAMLREQNRVKSVIEEKDQVIFQQKQEIGKLLQHQPTASVTSQTNTQISNPTSNAVPNVVPNGTKVPYVVPNGTKVPSNSVSVTSLSGLSPVALGGSLRIHGSFRQYKKDREKIRQQLKSGVGTATTSQQAEENSTMADSSSSSSGININSSEESSSSPSTLPRTQKGTLRQTLSSSAVDEKTCTVISAAINNKLQNQKKKGILKASSSVDSPAKEVLLNLDQLISEQSPSNNKSLSPTKIQISPEDRSDSGRESDDMVQNNPVPNGTMAVVPNVSVVTVSTTDSCSANSSFDASDPTLGWKINVKSQEKSLSEKDKKPQVPEKTLPSIAPRPELNQLYKNAKPEMAEKEDTTSNAAPNGTKVPYAVPNGTEGLTKKLSEKGEETIADSTSKDKSDKILTAVSSTLNKKVKPPPPPRSSQTRLSTIIKPKSILSPKHSLNTEISPTEALDNLIRNVDTNKLRQSEKKKRVKFNPRIDTSTLVTNSQTQAPQAEVALPNSKNSNPNSNKPLDPNFLHFLPRLNQKQQQQEIAKKTNQNQEIMTNENVNLNKNFSYYEPYI